jgi:hypothetical protein
VNAAMRYCAMNGHAEIQAGFEHDGAWKDN